MNEVLTPEFKKMLEDAINTNTARIDDALAYEDFAEAFALKEVNSVYEWILQSIDTTDPMERVSWVKYST